MKISTISLIKSIILKFIFYIIQYMENKYNYNTICLNFYWLFFYFNILYIITFFDMYHVSFLYIYIKFYLLPYKKKIDQIKKKKYEFNNVEIFIKFNNNSIIK